MKNLTPFIVLTRFTKNFFSRLVFSLLLVWGFTLQLEAQNPRISIQGTLRAANGTSVNDGSYNVTFKFYRNETGGTAMWEETAPVEVVGSIYSHYLGSVSPLVAADFDSIIYLGVVVNNYELIPRTELSYSPYALSVAFAQTVVCSGAVGDVKYSILNPTQFAAENGNCWVPMDGRSIAGSTLGSITGLANLPNGGGTFLRAQDFSNSNQDPDRDQNSPIAQLQSDGNKSHSHSMNSAGNHQHSFGIDNGGGGVSAAQPMLFLSEVCDQCQLTTTGALANWVAETNFDGSHTHTINADGISESRPKNLNFWIYIRIN